MAQNFVTKLSPEEEIKFQKWVKDNKITDVDLPESRYDYRGFYQETKGAPHPSGDIEHFPDTYKQPGHPTFSVESKYAKGRIDAGSWNGDTFIPPKQKMPQLAELWRKKYPGAYDDMDDSELETAILAKYPVYKDLTTPERHPATSEEFSPKSKPFLEFLPTSQYDEYGIELPRRITHEDPFIKDSSGRTILDHKKEIQAHPTMIANFGKSMDYYRNMASDTGNVRGAILTSLATEPMRLVGDIASDPVGAIAIGGMFKGLNTFRNARPPITPSIADLGNAPSQQKLLTGKRFYGETPENTVDINTTPLRRGREVPYRSPESFSTAEGDTQAATDTFNKYVHSRIIQPESQKLLTAGEEQIKYPTEEEITSEFTPEEDQSMGGIYPTKNQAALEAFHKSLQKDVQTQDLERMFSVPEKIASSEKPQGMRVTQEGQEGAALGPPGTTKIFNLLSHNVYKNEAHKIIPKELIQNAIDAVKFKGDAGNIDVHMDIPRMRHYRDPLHEKEQPDYKNNLNLIISDNGTGMDRNELQTVFTNLGESGKENDPTASGGFGLAKAIIYKGSSKISVETVKDTPKGRMKYIMNGDPSNYDKFMPIIEMPVEKDVQTGTKVKVSVPVSWAGQNHMDEIKNYIHNTVKYSSLKGNINYHVSNYEDPITSYSKNPKTGLTDYIKSNVSYPNKPASTSLKFETRDMGDHISDADSKNASLSVYKEPNSKSTTSQFIPVHLLNNGLYQGSYDHQVSYNEPLSDLPSGIIVNVNSKIKEGDEGYPWELSREGIIGDAKKALNKVIKEEIVDEIEKKRKEALQKLYDNLPEITVPGAVRKAIFFDPGNRLTPRELKEFITSPVIVRTIQVYDRLLNQILTKLGKPELDDRLEGIGIVLSPELHGIHVPNPATGKSTIGMNPFIRISREEPADAAYATTITALHEAAHIGSHNPTSEVKLSPADLSDPRVGKYLEAYLNQIRNQGGLDSGHAYDFEKRLGEVFSTVGIKHVNEAADELTEIFSDEFGGYNPETERLLQIYQISRGRSETTEDLLSRTGVGSRDEKSRTEGNKTGGDRPDGKRTTPTAEAVSKLIRSIGESKGLREQLEADRTADRARRFAAFEGVKTPGMAGAAKSLGKLKGEYEKVDVPSHLEMSKADIDSLFTAVKLSNISTPEKATGYTALFKLINGGELPVRSELATLDHIFGGGFSDKIIEMHGGLGMIGLRIGKLANTMKSMRSAMDFSFPLRQGVGLIHRKEFRKAFIEMFKYAGNTQYYKDEMDAIDNDIYSKLGRDSGLFIGKPGEHLNSEEAFLNSYVGNLPAIKQIVGFSERAYSGMANKVRFDTFKALIQEAKTAGHEAFTLVDEVDEEGNPTGKKRISPSKLSTDLAKYINVSTGRGNLGSMEKMASELNWFIWSPRLIKSRFTVFNPYYYKNLHPFVRKQAIKSLFSIAATGAIIGTLGALGGSKVVGNPFSGKMDWLKLPKKGERILGNKSQVLSADFGKVRSDEKVLDPWAGFQQPIVTAARMIAGRTDTKSQDMITTAGNFAVNKLSPIMGLAYQLARAQKFTGKSAPGSIDFKTLAIPGRGGFVDQYGNEKYLNREIAVSFAPLFGSDFIQLIQDDPSFKEVVGFSVPSILGAGTQNYPEPGKKNPRQLRKPSLSF